MNLNKTIDILNSRFADLFADQKGIRIRGISEMFTKKNADKSTVLIPGIKTGNDIEYLGADDKDSILIYHRLNTSSFRENTATSYGDTRSDQIITYNLGLYVIIDSKIICFSSLELSEKIQSVLPDSLVMPGYKSVIIKLSNINFNTLQILRSESQGLIDIKPLLQKTALLINYQIENTFRKECISVCA
jgi:hypothetical protein